MLPKFASCFATPGNLYIYPAPCCSPEDCMKDLDLARPEAPSVMVVDAGDVFVGGRYHSLVPILREVGC